MNISNLTQQTIIADQACVAKTFLSRFCGLIGKKELKENEALIIYHCQCIHMFFMRFCIDAIFANCENRVIGLVKNIKPFSLSPCFFKAHYVVELPAQTIEKSKTQIGDQLRLSE